MGVSSLMSGYRETSQSRGETKAGGFETAGTAVVDALNLCSVYQPRSHVVQTDARSVALGNFTIYYFW